MIYLVRHGQAGTREAYDALSDKGRRQARLLGEYFVNRRISFARAYSGSLRRQRQTAAEVAAVYREMPEPAVDSGWDEFDLDHIYRELGPVLSEEDPEFRREFEAPQSDRHWTPCDMKIVTAWVAGHPRFRGETWLAFHERIAGCRAAIRDSDEENVVVFTSATPIGIWAALSLDVADHRALRLAGVLHNASYTTVRLSGDQLRLHTFNAIPHLPEPDLQTHR